MSSTSFLFCLLGLICLQSIFEARIDSSLEDEIAPLKEASKHTKDASDPPKDTRKPSERANIPPEKIVENPKSSITTEKEKIDKPSNNVEAPAEQPVKPDRQPVKETGIPPKKPVQTAKEPVNPQKEPDKDDKKPLQPEKETVKPDKQSVKRNDEPINPPKEAIQPPKEAANQPKVPVTSSKGENVKVAKENVKLEDTKEIKKPRVEKKETREHGKREKEFDEEFDSLKETIQLHKEDTETNELPTQSTKQSENTFNASKKQSSEPIHVAILTGCDSHFSVTAQIASSLIKWPSIAGKYRVTYVTSSNCRDRVEKLGAQLHDNGVWYFPITDPDVGVFEFYKNLTMGILIHTVSSLESLMMTDRPDIVISDPFGAAAGTVAEKYDVPFLVGMIMSFPSTRQCKDGAKVPTPLTPSFILDESNPMWLLKAACTVHNHIGTIMTEVIAHEARWKMNEIRQSNNQEQFDNINHMFSYYPILSLLGKPLTHTDNYEDKILHVGVLPDVSPAVETKMEPELIDFIQKSDKPLIYISLGTYFAFSEKHLQVIVDALAGQPHYNVIWSNKRWTPEMDEKLDKGRFFMRASLPQRNILECGKVKIFVSHCGASSLVESIRAGVPVIGVPQGRDQYFLARSAEVAKMGVQLSSEPAPQDLLQALDTIRSNWLFYHNNMKDVLHQLTHNSQQNLERVIDMFVAKGHAVVFKNSSLFPSTHAFALFGTVVILLLVIPISILYCMFRLCCSRKSTSVTDDKKTKKKKKKSKKD